MNLSFKLFLISQRPFIVEASAIIGVGCQVPGYAGITDNEVVEDEANRALELNPDRRKVPTRGLKLTD
jgi:hypothetical protein